MSTKRIRTLLATTCAAAGVAVAAPAPPAAQADTPCGSGWSEWVVPQQFGSADFRPACVGHDACYGTGSPVNRLDCDVRLRDDLYQSCAEAYGAGPGACTAVADEFFAKVRSDGFEYYQGAGLNN